VTVRATFRPNALIPSQVARAVGVKPQSVAERMATGRLEHFKCLGVIMIPVRAVRRWEREREARARARKEA
jgi:hypothetical protein